MARTLRVAAVSHEIRIGDLVANLAAASAALGRAVGAGAEFIVLPELATSGYVFDDKAEASAVAIPADDHRLRDLAALVPADRVAVVGFCERDGDELFNSAAVLSGGEVLSVYRKSHLWAREKTIFATGDAAGVVVDTPVGRVGVAICYDNEFPEVPRGLALAGAEVLALPVNWPLVERPDGEHAPEIIQAMAAARSSRLPTVIADRHGLERGIPWTGGTAVVSGDGWIVAGPENTGAPVVADIEIVGHTVLGEFNDLIGDRRPELYHPAPRTIAPPSID
ncbi:nitrilase-related carbon-nitrogen hydrolase [Herbiconiux sp. L3-i23]|uniref:nitrilase-related carbon-nitrogen hydrolase n=1 Tax=Herbiconiux sp. L3-i23 TaxID=2905871 RepID=UPI0020583361|nr:nitrilase-related carbon-nitrogen hydrolase [Herbiconiux sp. L3-i23]BDI23202.1 carbon-nitrogen hydrolase [Herbiconiux sp. L3-i23]